MGVDPHGVKVKVQVSDAGTWRDVTPDDLGGSGGTEPATTATHTDLELETTAFLILAANPDRLGATIYNSTDERLYVLLGTMAASEFTVIIEATQYYEVPFNWRGRIDGIGDSNAPSGILVTELEA